MIANDYPLPPLAAELPEYLSELALAISSSLNVHFGMGLTTLLSGMASAVHGVKAVRRPDGGAEPLALFCFVLSNSATGKTRTYRLVHGPHYAQDATRYAAYLLAKEAGNRVQLRDVIQPITNNRFLLKSLEGVGQATAISNHDSKTLLNSYFFRHHLDIANVLWDGNDKVTLPVASGERLLALDASLNLLVMTQPDIFREYLAKHGETSRAVGFIPRCLFMAAAPVPHRPRRQSEPACIDEYRKDAMGFLNLQRAELNAPRRELIEFSPAAAEAWFAIQDELDQFAAFQYPGAQDAVGRALQNVTRVAGVIHCFYPSREDDSRVLKGGAARETTISVRTLHAAWAIVREHLRHFSELFPPKPFLMPPPPNATTQQKREQRLLDDAETVMVHFEAHCRNRGESSAPKSAVMTRTGLYPLRFDAALIRLVDGNHLIVEGSGKKTRLSVGPRPFTVPPQFPAFPAYPSNLAV